MATWIFQGNPDIFDIDGYLRQSTGEIRWLVRQHAKKIKIGDEVFVWRSKGTTSKLKSGVVAKAVVVSDPAQIPDDEASSFYTTGLDTDKTETRVRLRLLYIANQKEMVQRDWLKDDSALSNLSILKQAAGTNFPVTESESVRLNTLWANSGKPWSEDECEKALGLYEELFGEPIGKGAGSKVEKLAQLIGRAPTGVYNKLMNFRALDPRAEQKGLSSGSKVDALIWDRLYDPVTKTVKAPKFADLAPQSEQLPPSDRTKVEDESLRLQEKPLDELLKRYKDSAPKVKPRKKLTSSESIERDPLVVAITRLRSNYCCEVENCPTPSFLSSSGKPYVEVHHLHQLSDGGLDSIENTVALCAQHHREIHFGKDSKILTEALIKLRNKNDATG